MNDWTAQAVLLNIRLQVATLHAASIPNTRNINHSLVMTDRDHSTSIPSGGALARLAEALGSETRRKGLPPVERWNPPYCGEIDMRIAADGSWHYNGSVIGRPALVRLFASVLRKDPERYVLVTPVERVGITVEDVPFVAGEMAVEGEGSQRQIAFRTNVDDFVSVGPDHPLRFERDATGGLKPYVLVRRELWARVTRAVTYDLVELGAERNVDGRDMFGIEANGMFFPVAPLTELESLS